MDVNYPNTRVVRDSKWHSKNSQDIDIKTGMETLKLDSIR